MPQYNYETGQMEETDDERRQREAAEKSAGTTPVTKQEDISYEDGSQTRKTTQEIPAAAGPVAPAPAPGFQGQTDEFGGVDQAVAQQQAMSAVAPQQTTDPQEIARRQQAMQAMMAKQQAAAPAAAAAPAGPVAPAPMNQQAYNANIGAQESGNRADIGYHDRSKGTAYGQYGITDAAYQDARRADPSLPADKTQATPAQQTAAMNAFTQQNARYLQGYGIEPTQNNLAAAHFVGAKGLSDFMTRKDEQGRPYISPQAQAANGGYDKAAAIINSRLGGQAAAASGATARPTAVPGEGVAVATGSGVQGTQTMNQPAETAAPTAPVSPYSLATGVAQQGLGTQQQRMAPPPVNTTQAAIDRYQSIQDRPDELMKFAFDAGTPDYLKQRAKDQIVEGYDRQKKEAEATKILPTLGPNELARAMTKKSDGNSIGDWMQYLLFKHVGLGDLANQKAEQLGIGHKWSQSTITDEAGNDVAVEVQTTASGKVLGGNRLDGTALTAKELSAAGGSIGSKLNIVGGSYVNDKTGEVGRFITDEKTGKSYIQTDKGRKPMAGFRPQSSSGTAADQRAKLIQEMNIKLQGKAGEEAMAIQRDYNKLLVGQGLLPMQPGETPISAPQIAGAAPASAPAGAAPASTSGAAAPAAGGAVAPAPAGAAPAAGGGVRPTASQIAATAEAQKQEAQEVGVDLGKIKVNFGKSKDAATRLINQAEDLITDKGFSVSVGASVQPGFQFIPGSDRATWKAKHEEVVGQTFLTAIESLKGMGALSDKEGDAATAAISRLKNTDQNEESFKTAVKELQFIVKRGVDRNAEKLGREKPFGTTEPEVGTVDMSPQSRAAAELERRKKEKKP